MSPNTQDKSGDLQFDRVETKPGQPTAEKLGPAVSCESCRRSIETEYWHVNGKSVCNVCRQRAQAEGTTARGPGALVRALIYGVGAAIAGAAIYYAVMAIADLEIGIVAILIGYMVGYAVRKGALGRGGRRYQIIAAVLTYWAVGLAYTPFAIKGMIEGKSETSAVTHPIDSTGAAATAPSDSTAAAAAANDSTPTPAIADSKPAKSISAKGAEPVGIKMFLMAIGVILLLVFALPVTAVISSMPSGLISAFIIFIGLRQAWRMTGAAKLEVTGPYKVGAGPAPARS